MKSRALLSLLFLVVGVTAQAEIISWDEFLNPRMPDLLRAAAIASQLPLVQIQTQAYPGQVYTMGFELDQNRNLVDVYFYDPTKAADLQTKHIPIGSAPYVFYATKGYDVARISYQAPVMNIEYQQDARKDVWTSKKFEVQCDPQYHNCTVTDMDEHKVTNSLYIYNHLLSRIVRIVVGIDSIESR